MSTCIQTSSKAKKHTMQADATHRDDILFKMDELLEAKTQMLKLNKLEQIQATVVKNVNDLITKSSFQKSKQNIKELRVNLSTKAKKAKLDLEVDALTRKRYVPTQILYNCGR